MAGHRAQPVGKDAAPGVQHPNGPSGDQRLLANLNQRGPCGGARRFKAHPRGAEAMRVMLCDIVPDGLEREQIKVLYGF
ncbi:hypothetical protein Q8A67_019977 [Cirrhinus molitorella]|uniref:Uncharacterized protein n=1 Tax=Cirrhinus molitorella TaxID=172907 RepID=A0AA88PDD7_9TELE|nr:hypothetical protein Q8A67_019977 [Cirrhinus molitorella]